MSFSFDLEDSLTDEERAADKILQSFLKSESLHDDELGFNVTIHDFEDN